MAEKHYTLQLNAKVQPLDRGEMFEDPIMELLEKEGIGEIDGGGTSFDQETGEIFYCDVEIYLNDDSAESRENLIKLINKVGVPKGSFLIFIDGKEPDYDDEEADIPESTKLEIGTLEGLKFSINGTELPDEVYKNSDINKVIDDLIDLMEAEKVGTYYSYVTRNTHTDLIFYGNSFAKMKEIVEKYIPTYPLCEKSLIE
ncbi:hypothetical protein D8B46_00750, partial [Candidatus Gracilibacteria bacterium]